MKLLIIITSLTLLTIQQLTIRSRNAEIEMLSERCEQMEAERDAAVRMAAAMTELARGLLRRVE